MAIVIRSVYMFKDKEERKYKNSLIASLSPYVITSMLLMITYLPMHNMIYTNMIILKKDVASLYCTSQMVYHVVSHQ